MRVGEISAIAWRTPPRACGPLGASRLECRRRAAGTGSRGHPLLRGGCAGHPQGARGAPHRPAMEPADRFDLLHNHSTSCRLPGLDSSGRPSLRPSTAFRHQPSWPSTASHGRRAVRVAGRASLAAAGVRASARAHRARPDAATGHPRMATRSGVSASMGSRKLSGIAPVRLISASCAK